MRRNSYSIAPIFVENIDGFSKLKIVGLDQSLLKQVIAFVEADARGNKYPLKFVLSAVD